MVFRCGKNYLMDAVVEGMYVREERGKGLFDRWRSGRWELRMMFRCGENYLMDAVVGVYKGGEVCE